MENQTGMKESPSPFKKAVFTAVFVAVLAASFFMLNRGQKKNHVFTRPLLGTIINLTINSEKKSAQDASVKVFEEISRIEELMSPYKEKSEIFRINKSAASGYVTVGFETFNLIKISKEVNIESGGAFDISFAGLGGIWKTGSDNFIPPSREAVLKSLHLVNSRNIELDGANRVRFTKPGMKIGLGAIAKGYAVKRGADVMRACGITSGIVEAGGDLQVIGTKNGKPWVAGIRNPRENSLSFAVSLNDGESIVTSGDYERFSMYEGKRYHHIIDPRTGYPADGFASVSVIHNDPVMADAYSTSIFVMGYGLSAAFLKSRGDVSAVMIGTDMKVTASKRLKGTIEPLDGMTINWIE